MAEKIIKKIRVGGVDYDLVDSSATHDLNLENGAGVGSLAQKRRKSDGQTWVTAKAYQQASIAFGGNTQAGMTFEEWKRYNPSGTQEQYDASYSYAFASGEQNLSKGRDSFTAGKQNTVNADLGIALGENNVIESKNSIALGKDLRNGVKDGQVLIGKYNSEDSNAVLLVGNGTDSANTKNILTLGEYGTLKTSGQLVIGNDNSIQNPTNSYDIVCGSDNRVVENGANGVLIGEYNIAYHKNCGLIGNHLSSVNNNTFAVGYYNDYNNTSALFMVGNGSSSSNPHNAFEVLTDGKVKVFIAPTENNDVVRKADLDAAQFTFTDFSIRV